MRRTLALALTMTSVLAIACSGSAPTSASHAALTSPAAAISVAPSAPAALFGASVVDFASCLQTASAPGCFTARRVTTRDAGAGVTAPGAPAGLSATAAGSTVTLTWNANGNDAATTYVIEAGSAPGLADLANVPTSAVTSFSASGVGAGTYYVRVRAQNNGGMSGASNEAILIVGAAGCTSAPSAPGGLATAVNGSTVTLTWNAPAAGCASSSYVLQAGSSAGSSELANANVGAGTSYVASGVGAGTYYVRVRALNAYGQSAGSNEVVLIVTAGGAPSPVPGGIGGTWVGLAPDGTFTLDPQCPRDVDDIQFVFTQTGSNIVGTMTTRIRESFYPPDVGKGETGSLTGTVNGNTFSFSIVIASPIGNGPRPINAVAVGTFTSTRLTGTLNTVPEGTCTAGTFAVNRQ